MSIELIDILAEKLRSAPYTGSISVGTGEPLLYPHLAYFIEAMLTIDPAVRLRLLTNGMALHKELPAEYFGPRCTWGVTMDGFYQDSLAGLQEHVSIEQVKENVRGVVGKYGADRLYLNFTLNQANYRDLVDYCKFAVEQGIRDVYVTELKIYKGYEGDLEPYRLQRTKDFYAILDEARTVLREGGVAVDGFDVDCHHEISGCFRWDKASPIIEVDGTVSFCSGREDVYIGHIQDADIAEKWERAYERLSRIYAPWCALCHDRVLDGGVYSLPKTIQRPKKDEDGEGRET